MSRRLLFCGSRDWADYDRILQAVGRTEPDDVIVHGAARGADEMAARAARELGRVEEPHPADWDRLGRRAGYVRNVEMLNSGIDWVVAFDLGTRGTRHAIREARARGIPVQVIGRTPHPGPVAAPG